MAVPALVAAVRAGDRSAIARALSAVEAEPGGAVASALYRVATGAHVVGLTGAAGVGKSSLASALVGAWRAAGRRVGVVAVDPSSPLSGGAVLGDRVRLEGHLGDPGVFIRSLASRGHGGALAAAAADAVGVLDAAGFDIVLLETVGAGQGEVAVAETCHTVVLVLAPGLGDEVQALKAGLLEVADLYVMNKADLPGADTDAARLAAVLGLGPTRRPVLLASATTGAGVPELAAAIAAHGAALAAGDGWQERETRRATAALRAALERQLVAPLLTAARQGADGSLVAALVERRLDPAAAAATLLAHPTGANGRPTAPATPHPEGASG